MMPLSLRFTALLVFVSPAVAQQPVSGDIFDGQGGPLLSGVVYHATGNLAVPAGETLTIEPGAILKLSLIHI